MLKISKWSNIWNDIEVEKHYPHFAKYCEGMRADKMNKMTMITPEMMNDSMQKWVEQLNQTQKQNECYDKEHLANKWKKSEGIME